MSCSAFIPALSHQYDPLRPYTSVLLWLPFRRSHQRLETLSPHAGGSLIFQCFSSDPFKYSNSRDSAFSQRKTRAFLHLVRGFNSPSKSISRNPSFRELEVCKVVINTDDAFPGRSRGVCRQHGRKHLTYVRTRAFNQQGGGGGGGDGGRTIFNLAAAGLLTYLTVTGSLNWLFDAILTLWVVSAVLGWFAERSLVRGPCPNCGGEFQVFEFSLKEQHRLCPYCGQPFKLENKKFVRDEPKFSNERTRGYEQPFGGFGGFDGFRQPTSSSKKEDSSGVIVDIEAEVRDKE